MEWLLNEMTTFCHYYFTHGCQVVRGDFYFCRDRFSLYTLIWGSNVNQINSEVYLTASKFSRRSIFQSHSRSLSVCLSVSVQTMKYLLNLHSDFHETLRAVFLGHLKLKSRVSKKSEYIYYPLPMYFCSIFGVVFV